MVDPYLGLGTTVSQLIKKREDKIMDNKIVGFSMFVIGAAIGSFATWQYTKKKYEKIAQEEIDSVKEVFQGRFTKPGNYEQQTAANNAKSKPAINEYISVLEKHGYDHYSETEKKEATTVTNPRVISPTEFDDNEDYDKISLTLYADNVLADENDEPVDDVDEVVGEDSLGHFGEYEEDSVFVRNDDKQCDYEITKDLRNYSDVVGTMPHSREE